MFTNRLMSFSFNCLANIAVLLLARSKTLTGIDSISSFPAMILEKSSMSLIMVNKDSPELYMVLAYWRCFLLRSVDLSSSLNPIMPFNGVRISWLIMARKAFFERLSSADDCLIKVFWCSISFAFRRACKTLFWLINALFSATTLLFRSSWILKPSANDRRSENIMVEISAKFSVNVFASSIANLLSTKTVMPSAIMIQPLA